MLNISNNIYSDYNKSNAVQSKMAVSPSFCGANFKTAKAAADVFVSQKPRQSGLKRFLSGLFTRTKRMPEPPKISDDLHGLIVELSGKNTYANGKDAVVHSIPGRDDMVLRIEKTVIPKADELGKDLVLVPIKFDKSAAENKNLGIPLYFVAEKGSEIAQKGSLKPIEALSQKDNIMILKKVSGQHPSQEYWDRLCTLMGYDDLNPSVEQLQNFHFLGYVRKNYGNDAAVKCLENCKNGITKVKPEQLGKGSPEFDFADGETFYKNYRAFADSYVKSLKDISEMPQEAYDKAVKDILSSKGFIMDFQHTDNTFVDFEKKEFNFMDFCYDKELYPKYYYDNPIKEFGKVLMGKCFSSKFKSPRQLMIYPEDIKNVKIHSNAIQEKVNTAAPAEYRSELPFRTV